jgi:two-component system OmpR family sensor kinase
LRREQAVAVIQVLDTGPGIQTVERERVFDPFYRILGNDELGSGLGLSIVRAIVDRVGGSVTLADVESDDAASGLCVTVRWPGCLDRVL